MRSSRGSHRRTGPFFFCFLLRGLHWGGAQHGRGGGITSKFGQVEIISSLGGEEKKKNLFFLQEQSLFSFKIKNPINSCGKDTRKKEISISASALCQPAAFLFFFFLFNLLKCVGIIICLKRKEKKTNLKMVEHLGAIGRCGSLRI